MTANDDFVERMSWWRQRGAASLVGGAPDVANGYVRYRLQTGGAPGSFHFQNNDGYLDAQVRRGDGFWAADCQCLNADETDIPPAQVGGPPRAFGLAIHAIPNPEHNGWAQRNYGHVVQLPTGPTGGNLPPGATSSARMVTETKATRVTTTLFNTHAAPELRDAAALGEQAQELMGRWWLALSVEGQTIRYYHAPIRADGTVPPISDFILLDTYTHDLLPAYGLVGLVIYSSVTPPNVTGRCRRFVQLA